MTRRMRRSSPSGPGMRYEMGMDVRVKLMEATPLTGGLLFSMQSPPRPRRRDLKQPEREAAQLPRQSGPEAAYRWRRTSA